MSKKILFLTVLFAFFRISFVYSLEIIPLKKPLQSNEDKEKKLLIETTRPLFLNGVIKATFEPLNINTYNIV